MTDGGKRQESQASNHSVSVCEATVSDLLEILLETRLPYRGKTHATMRALLETRGVVGNADAFAHSVGMRDRHQLAYELHQAGLPALRSLAGWIRVAIWVAEAELKGVSLCCAALCEAQDPGSRYRSVKRVTGLQWSQVRARGFVWVVEEFARSCRPPVGDSLAGERRRA
jgi:hypothetical protein